VCGGLPHPPHSTQKGCAPQARVWGEELRATIVPEKTFNKSCQNNRAIEKSGKAGSKGFAAPLRSKDASHHLLLLAAKGGKKRLLNSPAKTTYRLVKIIGIVLSSYI
jgi:hypothetical protein